MRKGLPFLFMTVLAACGGDFAPPPSAPVTQIRAGFPPGGLVDTIHIETVERLPLRQAVLVAPNGVAIPASSLNIVSAPEALGGQRAVSDPWQSALLGGDANGPLAPSHAQAMASVRSREQLLAIASNADIPLADPVAYRRDWTRYRLHLTFGTPPNIENVELAAPELPPPPPR